jgi:hypothetical protein
MSGRHLTTFSIIGQRVTLERYEHSWTATGWHNGLPVARRPIGEEYAQDLLARYPHTRHDW